MSDMVYCRACGKQIHISAPACPGCGALQRGPGNLKSKTVAALLAIFLGGFGVHRFYLGQWWGVVYLLFCWTGIPGLISFVEGIVFACTAQANWDHKYNKDVPSGDSGAGKVIVIVVAAFFSIAVIGILAAVAIPAYSDYTSRAKVAEAVSKVRAATPLIGQYIESKGRIPDSLDQAGYTQTLPKTINHVEISGKTGELIVTLTGNLMIEGKSFSLIPSTGPDGHIQWRCVNNDLPTKALPSDCR